MQFRVWTAPLNTAEYRGYEGKIRSGRGGWENTEIGDEMREVELLKSELLEAIEQASDTEMLEAVRLDALGKKAGFQNS